MITSEIPKTYDPKDVESYWAEFWIHERLFLPQSGGKSQTFVIVIPPPNVTGSLHMGHALNNTLQDVLIRWKKMCGYETLWVPGTDHGGIATQNVVEKLLKQEGKSRHDLGREKFLERMWSWRKESGDTILMQLRRLGCLLDWTRTRFTMDETCSRSVMHAFMELYKKGWIYRGKRMVNWCIRCHTALSDIEVEYEERKDKLYYIRYPILSDVPAGWDKKYIVVATTRPETMLGDTAVAVNPKDKRYETIRNGQVLLPLVDKKIPVIADSAVDPEFGTGIVKVTPAHDPADFEIGEKHKLQQVVVIRFDGRMTSETGEYAGLSREECRKHIVEDLKKQDLVEKIEDYHHSVGVCYRCGMIVEPLVSDQWFLKVDTMANEAAKATCDKRVKIFPDSWTNPYLSWLDNLRDWCISRQIWWGHRIPVWYCVPKVQGPKSKVQSLDSTDVEHRTSDIGQSHPSLRTSCPPVDSLEDPKTCSKCGGNKFEQDPDVLDTWFSSALWPFSVFKWPERTEDLNKYYPTSVLVTGHEILYLWVARMVMMGLNFLNKIPFSHVFIHGIVRDKQGRKMSKSLGNVIDPLIMMDKYGTDALRFVLTSQSVPGRDMQIADDTFIGARNFANKIWNVSRFVLMNLAESEKSEIRSQKSEVNWVLTHLSSLISHPSSLELCDRWILSRFQRTVQTVNQSLNDYNLAQASRAIYQFLWSEFCDWYVELSKIRVLDDKSGQKRETALMILSYLLDGILRLLHPIMPFITEEIWKIKNELHGKTKAKNLLLTSYPEFEEKWLDVEAESEMEVLMNVIIESRTIRAEMNISPAEKISMILNVHNDSIKPFLNEHADYIRHLCKVGHLEIGNNLKKPYKAVSAVITDIEIFIPLEGLIDFEKEKNRLSKEIGQAQDELTHLEKRLSDPQFKSHAPEEEVKKTLQRKEDSLKKLKRLQEHISLL